uniref:EF-hand domain-containing protein n=1 Tax=Globisporangium ultimum (strain ATCC 200006 / CBS 805.95 / DAOM BR144) TaxID=431595 RepID=K3WQU4_GLOUD
MALVLQRVKHKQLSAVEGRESQAAFQLITGESANGAMDAKQLKCCLRALGFAVDAAEARALVYEFDYNDTQTIGLVDFQRIYLFKSLERSQAQLLNQAWLSKKKARQIRFNGINYIALHCPPLRDTRQPQRKPRGNKMVAA